MFSPEINSNTPQTMSTSCLLPVHVGMEGIEDVVVKEEWLQLVSNDRRQKHQRRYFVLTSEKLSYYKKFTEKKRSKPKNIELNDISEVSKFGSLKKDSKYGINIDTAYRAFLIFCPSEESRDEWMGLLPHIKEDSGEPIAAKGDVVAPAEDETNVQQTPDGEEQNLDGEQKSTSEHQPDDEGQNSDVEKPDDEEHESDDHHEVEVEVQTDSDAKSDQPESEVDDEQEAEVDDEPNSEGDDDQNSEVDDAPTSEVDDDSNSEVDDAVNSEVDDAQNSGVEDDQNSEVDGKNPEGDDEQKLEMDSQDGATNRSPQQVTCLNDHELIFTKFKSVRGYEKFRCDVCKMTGNLVEEFGVYFCPECDHDVCWNCFLEAQTRPGNQPRSGVQDLCIREDSEMDLDYASQTSCDSPRSQASYEIPKHSRHTSAPHQSDLSSSRPDSTTKHSRHSSAPNRRGRSLRRSKSHSDDTTKEDDDDLTAALETMKAGTSMHEYNQRSTPIKLYFFLSKDGTSIYWNKKRKRQQLRPGLDITGIASLQRGRQAKSFRASKVKSTLDVRLRSFSLIAKRGISLDLECETREKCEVWIKGIEYCMKCQKYGSRSRSAMSHQRHPSALSSEQLLGFKSASEGRTSQDQNSRAVIKNGWVLKRDDHSIRSYNKMFLVLNSNGMLSFYARNIFESTEKIVPIGVIKTENITGVKYKKGRQTQRLIIVDTRTRSFVFDMSNSDNQTHWMDALNAAVHRRASVLSKKEKGDHQNI